MPNEDNKKEILDLMKDTRTRRLELLKSSKLSLIAIIRQFPHFLSYEGTLVIIIKINNYN